MFPPHLAQNALPSWHQASGSSWPLADLEGLPWKAGTFARLHWPACPRRTNGSSWSTHHQRCRHPRSHRNLHLTPLRWPIASLQLLALVRNANRQSCYVGRRQPFSSESARGTAHGWCCKTLKLIPANIITVFDSSLTNHGGPKAWC